MNNELVCRELNSEDQLSLNEFTTQKKSIFKIPVFDKYLDSLQPKLDLSNENICFFALFRNDKIIATWGIYRWKQLPYYTLNELLIDNPTKSSVFYITCINLLLEKMIPKMELEGRFQFYMLTLLRTYQLSALRKGHMWTMPEEIILDRNYDIFLEALIPANTRPDSSVYWDLMGRKEWPKDLWIRRGVLKSELLTPRLLRDSGLEGAPRST